MNAMLQESKKAQAIYATFTQEQARARARGRTRTRRGVG